MLADLEITAEDGDNITITHFGGESIDTEATTVQVDQNDFALDGTGWEIDGDTNVLRPGETAVYDYGGNGTVEVLVVSDTANEIIAEDTVTLEELNPFFTVDIEDDEISEPRTSAFDIPVTVTNDGGEAGQPTLEVAVDDKTEIEAEDVGAGELAPDEEESEEIRPHEAGKVPEQHHEKTVTISVVDAEGTEDDAELHIEEHFGVDIQTDATGVVGENVSFETEIDYDGGDAITRTATASIDGTEVDSEPIEFDPFETEHVEFEFAVKKEYNGETITVAIGESEDTAEVTVTEPEEYLEIESPLFVFQGSFDVDVGLEQVSEGYLVVSHTNEHTIDDVSTGTYNVSVSDVTYLIPLLSPTRSVEATLYVSEDRETEIASDESEVWDDEDEDLVVIDSDQAIEDEDSDGTLIVAEGVTLTPADDDIDLSADQDLILESDVTVNAEDVDIDADGDIEGLDGVDIDADE